MKIIDAIVGGPSRSEIVDGWISRLAAAERQARARVEADPKLKARLFLVNYRIAVEDSVDKGDDDQRRDALIAMIRSLETLERHISTSTWLIRVHIQAASTLSALLGAALDGELDGLHVTRASSTNRAAFGVTELQS